MTNSKKFNGNKSEVFYMNEVFDSRILATPGLSSSDSLIYIALVRYSNGGKDNCYPSQKTLGEATGNSERTVVRSIDNLINLGFIKLIKKGSGYSKKSNEYKVYMPSEIKIEANLKEPIEPIAAIPAIQATSEVESVAIPSDLDLTDCWEAFNFMEGLGYKQIGKHRTPLMLHNYIEVHSVCHELKFEDVLRDIIIEALQ